MPTTFVALYRGQTVGEAKIIAVSADPALVADISGRLLRTQTETDHDSVIQSVEEGRRRALRLIKRQAQGGQEECTR
jgi:hypothetical protein